MAYLDTAAVNTNYRAFDLTSDDSNTRYFHFRYINTFRIHKIVNLRYQHQPPFSLQTPYYFHLFLFIYLYHVCKACMRKQAFAY